MSEFILFCDIINQKNGGIIMAKTMEELDALKNEVEELIIIKERL